MADRMEHTSHDARFLTPYRDGPRRSGLRAEVFEVLCLESLLTLASAEAFLDHLERR
jgi:hypothetical protein